MVKKSNEAILTDKIKQLKAQIGHFKFGSQIK